MVSLARKTLFHERIRFLSTVWGVGFAVNLILLQVGLFLGILEKASISIERSSADIWVTSKATPNVDFAHPFPENAVLRVRGVPGVERADNLIVSFAPIKLPSGAQETSLLYGLDDFRAWHLPWDIREGQVDDLKRGMNVFLDSSATKRFGAFKVGDYREVVDRRFQIIGITDGANSFSTAPIAFMSYRNLQSLSELLTEKTTYILVKAARGADVQQIAAEIRRRLPYNDVHTKAEWSALSRAYWVETTGLGARMGITVFLGILVGILTVSLTLYSSVLDHVKEFATVKAIGGSAWDIYRIIGEQAVIIAVVGFLIGCAFAYGLSRLIAKAGLNLIVSHEFLAVVLTGTLMLCLSAALLSFRRVKNIDPMLVLRG